VTPFSRDEMELSYERSRYPIEDARRTIIASFMGFGSDSVTRTCRTGFRSNSNRSGTTPAHDWASWPNQIEAFTARLIRGRAREPGRARGHESRRTRQKLFITWIRLMSWTLELTLDTATAIEMADSDHEELLTFLIGLRGLRGRFRPTSIAIYERLASARWAKSAQETLVMQNRTGIEALWMNPAAAGAQRQLRML
jgi:DNA adenine methylase